MEIFILIYFWVVYLTLGWFYIYITLIIIVIYFYFIYYFLDINDLDSDEYNKMHKSKKYMIWFDRINIVSIF